MKPGLAIVLAAAWLLSGCNGQRNPYLSNHDSRGTPSLSGASDIPWVRGGGPAQELSPAPSHNSQHPG